MTESDTTLDNGELLTQGMPDGSIKGKLTTWRVQNEGQADRYHNTLFSHLIIC